MVKRSISIRHGLIRRLGLVLGALMVLGAAAYASLPLWFPGGWFAARLERELSQNLGLPVQLGRFEIGWLRGVVMEDMRIGQAGVEWPRARVERLRCAFTPLRTLLTGQVNELQIDRPELFIDAGGDGQLSWDDFGRSSDGDLPTFNYVLRDVACHVKTPRGTETIRMDRLECRLEPASGAMRLRGEVRVPPAADAPADTTLRRLNVSVQALLPRLNPAVKLGGDLRIEWTALTLTDLPLRLIPELPVEQVAGNTSGSLTLKAQADLGLDYAVEVSLKGVKLRDTDSPRSATIPDALMSCAGHWDPAGDVVELHDLDVRTPGLRLVGVNAVNRPVLRLDVGEKNPVELHVTGTVQDWRRCADEWPPLAQALQEHGATLDGSANFQADITRRFNFEHLVVKVDMGAASCKLTDGAGRPLVDAPAGAAKIIATELTLDRKEFLRAEGSLSVGWGGGSLKVEGTSAVPATWLDADDQEPWQRMEPWARSADLELSLKWDDVARQLETLPVLRRQLEGRRDVRLQGAGQVEMRVRPTQAGSDIRLSVELPRDSQFALRDVLVKRPELPLLVYLETELPISREATISNWRLALGHGEARVEIGGPGSELNYRLAAAEADTEGFRLPEELRVTADMSLRQVQDCVALLPGAAAQLAELQPGHLAGDLTSTLAFSLSREPDELLMVTALELDTKELDAQLEDWFVKKPGQPLHVRFMHRMTGNDSPEHVLQATLQSQSGSLEAGGSVVLSKTGRVEAFHGGWLGGTLTDLAVFAELFPRWAAEMKDLNARGGLDFKLHAVSTAAGRGSLDHMLIDVDVDATALDARMPGERALTKQPNVPLEIAARGVLDTLTGENGSQFKLASAQLRYGDTLVDRLQGQVAFDRSLGACILEPETGAAAPQVVAGEWDLAASFRLGKMFRSLNADLARWCEDVRLAGEAKMQMHASWNNRGWRCEAQIDGASTSFDLPTGLRTIPRVAKPVGSPVTAQFQATGQGTSTGGGQVIDLTSVRVSVAGNELSANGSLGLVKQASEWTAEKVDLQTQLHLLHPEPLASWLPGTMVSQVGGQMDVNVALAKQGDKLTWGPAKVDFKDFKAVLDGESVGLSGHMVVAMDSLLADPLAVKWAGSDVTLSGSLRRDAQGQGGRVVVSSRSVDLPRIMDAMRQTSRRWGLDQPTTQPAGFSEIMAEVIPSLARTELRADAYADVLRIALPPNQLVQADALVASLQVDKGPVKFTFNAVAGGGSVVGEVTSQTQAADPTFYLSYKADDLQPGPLVDGYLRQTFPGMTATGPLTLIDETTQKILSAPGEPNAAVGKGELIIKGGYMVGRAAPDWVVNIFPGLNLSRYDFTYMHSWFTKYPTGRIRHQMIYQGTFYNVYMIGHNDPDHSFRYEVGIDFLADFDSKYWAETGQGRIPLFVKTGRMGADGELAEEEVTFASPQRTLEMLLLSNNPAVTAYYAVRKRVLGE